MAANDIVIRIVIDDTQGKKIAQTSAAVSNLATNTKKASTDMGTNMFKFRDSVNAVGNSMALVVRRIARLRTAVFILISAFAIRPAFAFFNSLIELSDATRVKFAVMQDNIDAFKKRLADRAEPFLLGIKVAGFEILKDIILIVAENSEVFEKLIAGFGRLYNIISTLAPPIWQFFANLASVIVELITIVKETIFTVIDLIKRAFLQLQLDITKFVRSSSLLSKFYTDEQWAAMEKEIGTLTIALRQADATMIGHYATLKNLTGLESDLAKAAVGMADAVKKYISGLFDEKTWQIPDMFKRLILSFRIAATRVREFFAKGGEGDTNAIAEDSVANFVEGVKSGLAKHSVTLNKLGFELGDAIASGIRQGLSDALFTIMEGKFNKLKDVAISALKSIQRAIANLLASQIVSSLVTPLATGGGGGGGTGLQYGGVVGFRQERVIGEAGPEAVVPLKHGAIPVTMNSIPRASKATPSVVNNITFSPQVIDGPSFSSWLNKEKGTVKKILVDAAVGGDMTVRSAFRISR